LSKTPEHGGRHTHIARDGLQFGGQYTPEVGVFAFYLGEQSLRVDFPE
jgi:hypothetical protein